MAVNPIRLEREHAANVVAWAEVDAAGNVTSGVKVGDKVINSQQLAKLTAAAADAAKLAAAVGSLV